MTDQNQDDKELREKLRVASMLLLTQSLRRHELFSSSPETETENIEAILQVEALMQRADEFGFDSFGCNGKLFFGLKKNREVVIFSKPESEPERDAIIAHFCTALEISVGAAAKKQAADDFKKRLAKYERRKLAAAAAADAPGQESIESIEAIYKSYGASSSKFPPPSLPDEAEIDDVTDKPK